MRSDQPEELDRILDQALRSYSSAEPRHGLEQRVLSRVRFDDAERPAGWWRWAVAIPLLASVLVVALVYRQKPQPRTAAPAVASARVPLAGSETAAVTVMAHPVRRQRHHASKTAAAPKTNVFPRPSPLSSEERALLTLVAKFPDEARQALAADERSREPIKIDRIQIPLLSGGIEQ